MYTYHINSLHPTDMSYNFNENKTTTCGHGNVHTLITTTNCVSTENTPRSLDSFEFELTEDKTEKLYENPWITECSQDMDLKRAYELRHYKKIILTILFNFHHFTPHFLSPSTSFVGYSLWDFSRNFMAFCLFPSPRNLSANLRHFSASSLFPSIFCTLTQPTLRMSKCDKKMLIPGARQELTRGSKVTVWELINQSIDFIGVLWKFSTTLTLTLTPFHWGHYNK